MKFKVPVSEFEKLNGLTFDNASASWGRFIRHNRLGGRLHGYDIVEGPMLANPKPFLRGADPIDIGNQISFHSNNAVDTLMKYLSR